MVLLSAHRTFPNDTLALRVGFAASWGPLTTIDPLTGAPAMGWHGDPSQLVREPYTADWGVGMFGGASQWGCYVAADADLGGALVGYGCDVAPTGSGAAVVASPYDGHRRMLYISPLGLQLTLRSSAIASATLDLTQATLTLAFDHARGGGCAVYSATRLVIDIPAHPDWVHASDVTWVSPPTPPPLVRGAFELPCSVPSITLSWTTV